MSDTSLRIERTAKTLREITLERMRDAILEFRFQPGERLVERVLCEQLGVSRTVVREVLRHLEAEGLVATIAGQGPAVARPDLDGADEIYELRSLLEGLAARACAETASESDVGRLRTALAEIAAAWDSGKAVTVLKATTRFYDILFQAAGKRIAGETVQGLNARINYLRAMTIASADRREPALGEMRAILAAIEARDGAKAEASARRHVETARGIAREVLRASAG